MKIAIKDSIQYTNNLTADFVRPVRALEYFWMITGQDVKLNDFSMPRPADGWNVFRNKRNTRYINAKTGEIVEFDAYQKMDK